MIKAAVKIACLLSLVSLFSSCAMMSCLDTTTYGGAADCNAARVERANKHNKEYFARQEAEYRAQTQRAADEKAAEEARIFIDRGEDYYTRGQYEQAIAEFDNAIGVHPRSAWAHAFRGLANSILGHQDTAREDFDKAIALKQNYANAYRLRADVLYSKGYYNRALADYGQAISRNANDAEARNKKAWMLATSAIEEVRNEDEAVRLAKQAVKLSDNAQYRDTLAAAYAEDGQFAKAVEEMKRAIEMLRASGDATFMADFNAHLSAVEQRQPYRDWIF